MLSSMSKRRTGGEIVQNIATRRRKRQATDAGPQDGAATGGIIFPVAAKTLVKTRILDANDVITMEKTMMERFIGSQRIGRTRGKKNLESAQEDANLQSARMPSRKSKKTNDGQGA